MRKFICTNLFGLFSQFAIAAAVSGVWSILYYGNITQLYSISSEIVRLGYRPFIRFQRVRKFMIYDTYDLFLIEFQIINIFTLRKKKNNEKHIYHTYI